MPGPDATYEAVLDDFTCAICAAADGGALNPAPRCTSRLLCRCVLRAAPRSSTGPERVRDALEGLPANVLDGLRRGARDRDRASG